LDPVYYFYFTDSACATTPYLIADLSVGGKTRLPVAQGVVDGFAYYPTTLALSTPYRSYSPSPTGAGFCGPGVGTFPNALYNVGSVNLDGIPSTLTIR